MATVYASFERISEARKVMEELKKRGYANTHLDAVDKFYDEYSAEITVGGTGTAPSLSALILNSQRHLHDFGMGPLIAAHPMVSGMASQNEAADINTRLMIRVDDSEEEAVKKLLNELGVAL